MKKYFLPVFLFITTIVISILYINELLTKDPLGFKSDTFWGGQKNAHLLLNRIIGDQSNIVWATGNHTAGLLPLGTIGPEKYTKQLKGIIDNTKIAQVLKAAVNDNINVILVIGDGMGPNHMAMSIYKNIAQQNDKKTFFEKIMNEGESAFVINNPYGEIVGSSATTATSIACGIKSRVGMLGVNHDGFPVENILEVAEKNGLATGVVSDAKIVDATPAAFYGHTIDRYDIKNLTEQLVNHDIEVIFGGGGSYFIPQGKNLREMKGFEDLDPSLDKTSYRTDSINYLETFSKMGYSVVNTASELNKVDNKSGKVVGFFSGESMSSLLDSDREKRNEPTLFDISKKAIEILSDYENGYFLMIESARIDFESHDNDAGAVYHIIQELNNILETCYEQFQKNPKNTLVVFTADHETGGLAFTYHGVPYKDRKPILLANGQEYIRSKSSITLDEYKKISEQDKSIFRIFEEAQNSEELFKLLNEHIPYSVTEEEAEMVFTLLKDYKKGK